MPYVSRDETNRIVGVFANPQFEGQEFQESAEIWMDPAIARAAKLAEVRELREGILNRLAGIAFAAQLEGDTPTTAAYITARLALLDITKDLPTDPVQIEDTVKLRWASIVGQCTPQMVSAFLQVDV